jgi:PEP-CTERM motif
MKFKLAFVAAFSLAVMQPNLASASSYILDTGTPAAGASFPILNQGQWFAAEFSATAGQTITDLSAYLNQSGGAGTTFTFAIYSDATGFIGERTAPTPVYTVGSTFEANGWTSSTANWTVPTTGDYWVAVEMSSCSRNCPMLDLVTEASDSTGTAPALAFASAEANHVFALETTSPFGIEVGVASAVPEAGTWAMMMLGFAGIGLMAYRRRGPALTAA